MFWGLVLEPSKKYTQKVQQSFHISQASLELSTSEQEPIQLILEYDGANYVLATLSKKSNLYQVPLDLNFNAGDQISLRTIGKGRVHLTGYHIMEDDLDNLMLNGEEESDMEEEETHNSAVGKQIKRKKPDSSKSPTNKKPKLNATNEAEASDDDSDEDTFDAEPDDSDLVDSDEDEEGEEEDEELELDEEDEDDEDEDEDDDEDDDDDDDEDDEGEEVVVKKKIPAPTPKNNKADVSVNGKSPKNKKIPDASKETPKSGKKTPITPGKEMKENKTPKSEKKSPKKGNQEQNKSQELSPQKKVLEGGVVIEELRLGEGQIAKPGKMVQVYYVGRLQSTKKQFDATTQGPGFKFRLGRGEVIKGWDIGLNGMKVGGKRRITIPAQLAYGEKGSPPAIPPNSALVFEVELKGLK